MVPREPDRQRSPSEVGLKEGLIFMVPYLVLCPVLEEGVARLLGIGLVAKPTDTAAALAILGTDLCELLIICLVVSRWLKIDLRSPPFVELPTRREALKWVGIGVLLYLVILIKFLHSEFSWGAPGALNYLFFHVVRGSVLAPVMEELVFRGLCFQAIRRRSRFLAYIGSSLLFSLSHSASYTDLLLHGNLGMPPEKAVLAVVLGLITAYIYESTGKLTLCILYHSVTNSMPMLGIMASPAYRLLMG